MSYVDTGRPVTPKGAKAQPKPRKRIPQVSKKKAAHRKSEKGQIGSAYMALAATLPCVQCGATHRKRDLHHCKDLPPHASDDKPYDKSPRKFARSGDRDVIPLCKFYCHDDGPDSLHKNRRAWREKHGPDYSYILPTRAAVAAMGGEIDF